MNWIEFFTSFFEDQKDPINRILDAGGCRECWLQGEMYLHAEPEVLVTNASPHKFDLSSDKYPMVAEIKICGGDYQYKMTGLIEADVRKLKSAPQDREKYMILVVDTRVVDTPLGKWLMTYKVDGDPPSQQIPSTHFVAKIWKVAQHAPPAD